MTTQFRSRAALGSALVHLLGAAAGWTQPWPGNRYPVPESPRCCIDVFIQPFTGQSCPAPALADEDARPKTDAVLPRHDLLGPAAIACVQVSRRGKVAAAYLLDPSGHRPSDEQALSAVRRLRFEPAVRDGRPVGTWHTLFLAG